jgi:hypothetical protein
MNKTIFLAAAAALAAPAGAATVVTSGTAGTNGATALYLDLPTEVSTSDGTATPAEIASWLGRPDDNHTGIGAASVTYDLGAYRLFDGAGQDLNVYETDFGGPEFVFADFQVSANGTTFFSVASTLAAAVNLAGDEMHSDGSFRSSFDLGGAATASGLAEFRYFRVFGTGAGTVSGNNGFDLEAVGFANFRLAANAVPEPASWAMMIAGFGLAGAAARRRTRKTALA